MSHAVIETFLRCCMEMMGHIITSNGIGWSGEAEEASFNGCCASFWHSLRFRWIHHGFTMDSPCCWGWWHGVCLGHSENQLVNWVLLRLATTRVRYRGLCRIGGDDSLAPSTCREILWCSADFWIDFGRFHPFAFPILQMLVRCFNLSIPSLRFLQEG